MAFSPGTRINFSHAAGLCIDKTNYLSILNRIYEHPSYPNPRVQKSAYQYFRHFYRCACANCPYHQYRLLKTYWRTGQYIVEFEQGGNAQATYGKALLENLSKDLSRLHGKGFSRSNLNYMRLFYMQYPICEKPSHKLSWSHYVELLKIDNELERNFYENQIVLENWSIPELKRQKKAALFLRLAASKNKDGVLQLARQGQSIQKPADLLRDPYILDFLKFPNHFNSRKMSWKAG